ncbi:unnamed protein product [Boreogadus saida]
MADDDCPQYRSHLAVKLELQKHTALGNTMAEIESTSHDQYLKDMEDELTCSICLSLFQCPVTISCGHNFCQDCLTSSWKESYDCPQCRAHFPTRPELKKNTVLSTVVEKFRTRSSMTEFGLERKEEEAVKKPIVMCDTCMSSEAAKTCLTCMASFCLEHVRPHHDNPNYRTHQLREPLADMSERVCPDHHKLMEFFCVQHSRCICSFCLQQVHKGCAFTTPDEQKALRESDLKSKLLSLDSKIEKTEAAISQVTVEKNKLKESVTSRKKILEAEYQQIREMLDKEEREAMNTVDRQLQSGEDKYNKATKRFSLNIHELDNAKRGISDLLSQSATLAFLQDSSVDLPSVVNAECKIPRVNLDTTDVNGAQTFIVVFKDYLCDLLKQPVAKRLAILKPDPPQVPEPSQSHVRSSSRARSRGPGSLMNEPFLGPGLIPGPGPFQGQPGVYPGPGHFPVQPGVYRGPGPYHFPPGVYRGQAAFAVPRFPGPRGRQPRKPAQGQKEKGETKMKASRSVENLLNVNMRDQSRGRTPERKPTEDQDSLNVPPSITSPVDRHELLQYATVLTLDPKTAHRRVKLSNDLTEASVMDVPANYPDGPARFSVCSQVLASKGFSRGRHYWEVKMSSNNFVGIGLSYNSMDRKGPTSRLGRNDQSWCVEWFTLKLSAWHANSETVLESLSASRIGVLVDCDEGTATFYSIGEKANPFHTFVFPFTQAVYPAFWIFSNTSSIALCKLSG